MCIRLAGSLANRSRRTSPLAKYSRSALEDLAAWCEQFSPTVGFDDSPEPDCVLLDVTGVANLFGGEQTLVTRIRQQLAAAGLKVCVALEDTIGAAWARAHFEEIVSGPLSVVSCQEDSSSSSATDNGQRTTDHYPIEALRLPEPHLAWLHELGIERLGQLAALPRAGLAERFGPVILHRWDQMTGRAAEPILAYRPPPSWEAEQSFEFSLSSRAAIETAIAGHLERLARALAERRWGVQRLSIELRCDSGAPVSLGLGVYRATASWNHLMDLVRLRLEGVQLPGPVSRVRIAASATAPLECRQQEMFDSHPGRDDAHHLAVLVDRLSSRLGWDAVVRARLRAEAEPEYAWQPQAWLLARRSSPRSKQPREAHGVRAALPRPLRLARVPQRVQVVSVVPDGAPQVVRQAKHEHRVVRSWGPERIETGWWRGRSARRDYYCIETSTGRWLWVFRELVSGKWFLHGWGD